mmetsp:Transcript_35338/g.57838  ORF Transcript_35338/g.57838 Transcript_35338/m.57838 type:complete len:204 (-) Transcript_35338:196-807(-)
MCMCERLHSIRCQRFIKRQIFIILNLRRTTRPNWLILIESLPERQHLLHRLRLWFIGLASLFVANRQLVVLLVTRRRQLILVQRDLLRLGALRIQINRVLNELRVALDDIADIVLVDKLLDRVRLQFQNNRRTTTKRIASRILGNGIVAVSARHPNLLIVIVGFRNDSHFVRHQKRRVETDAKLTNQIAAIRTSRRRRIQCFV